jgi:plasmid stabilization system protein ParE
MTRGKRGKSKVAPRIVWTERAVAALRAIDDYIAADNPAAAERWVGRLIAKAEFAARVPLSGRVVPEKARADVREVFLRTYRIVYRVRDGGILVLTVFEGHRLFPPDTLDQGGEAGG